MRSCWLSVGELIDVTPSGERSITTRWIITRLASYPVANCGDSPSLFVPIRDLRVKIRLLILIGLKLPSSEALFCLLELLRTEHVRFVQGSLTDKGLLARHAHT